MGATKLNLEETLRKAYKRISSVDEELKNGDLGLFGNSSLDSLMQAVISKIGRMISKGNNDVETGPIYRTYSNVGKFEHNFEFMPCLKIPEDGELILAKKDIFYRDQSFSSIITKEGKTIEFLYIKPDGTATLTLQYFSEGGRVLTRVCNYQEEKEFFLFNLPFFEYSIINNDGEEKDKLIKIAKANPASTIAKVYDFIQKNRDIVTNIENLFQKAEEQYNKEGRTKRDISSCNSSISQALSSFGRNLITKNQRKWGSEVWDYDIGEVEGKLTFTNSTCFYYSRPGAGQSSYRSGIKPYDYKAFFRPICFSISGNEITDVKYVEPSFNYVGPAVGMPKTSGYKIISEADFEKYINNNFSGMFKEAVKYFIDEFDSGAMGVYGMSREKYKNVLAFDAKTNTVKVIKDSTIDVIRLSEDKKRVEVLFLDPMKEKHSNYTEEEVIAMQFIAKLEEKIIFDWDPINYKNTMIENLKRNIVNANARYRNANSSLEEVRKLYAPLEEITNFIVSAYKSEIFVTML
jgi:hypothetical protein